MRQHFANHRLHLAVCLLALAAIVSAGLMGAPMLAAIGVLMCGTMMAMMVWMMVGMVRHTRR